MILADINACDRTDFVRGLAGIFEHSPWVAEAVVDGRPFRSIDDLHRAMTKIVTTADRASQLVLICAHPDLGTRLQLSPSSTEEQASAGLDRLSPEEFERFHALNTEYRDRFGFPFIIAVRDHTRAQILDAFVRRLTHVREAEIAEALEQISRIARIRLDQLIHHE